MWDVLEIEIATGRVLRVIAPNVDAVNAEATIRIAVMRRGVEDSFYVAEPAGKYTEGQTR